MLARRGLLAAALIGMAGSAIATGFFAALTGPCLRLLFAGDGDAAWLSGRFGVALRALPAERLRLALPFALLGVAVLRAGFGYLQNSRMAELCLRVIADLQERLHRRILSLPLSFFEGRHTGEVYAQFGSDLGQVERALSQGLIYSLRDAFQLVALTAVCVALDARLFLLAGATLPIGVLVIARFGKALRAVSVSMQERNAQLLAKTQEVIAGATVLRIYGAEALSLKAVDAQEAQLLAEGRRSAALRAAVTPVVEFLAYAGIALLLLALETRWLTLPPEKLVSFFGAVLLAYQPLKSISTNGQWVVPGLAAAERTFRLLDAPSVLIDPAAPKPLPASPTEVAFSGVSVRYGERAALANLDLRIPAGQRLAICGRSGAGKSTLLHLIPRLLDPSAGVVRWGGLPVTEASLTALRARVALVGQDVFLFDATVAQNLQVGGVQRSTAELEHALEVSGALGFVRALPDGLQTRLGERGLTLSGGERQRLSLARALLKDAPVLLLDEAMSALDPPLEAEILERLTGGSTGRLTGDARHRTVLAVTHRLASAAKFERVIVLEAGQIVEDGPPAQLLAQSGWFARASREQSGAAP